MAGNAPDSEIHNLKQAMHEAMYQQSPIGTALYALDGRLLELNPAALLLMGIPSQEAASHFNLFSLTFLPEAAKTGIQQGRPARFTFQYDFDQASRRGIFRSSRAGVGFFECQIIPLQNPESRISAFLALIQDISERHQDEAALSESEFRYRMFFDCAGDSLFVHDFQGKLLDVNRTALEALGYERNELINRNIALLDSPATAEHIQERMTQLQASGRVTFEGEHIAKNGRRIPVEVNARLIAYNGQPAVLGVARDMTERKIAEKIIADLNERFAKAFELNPMPMSLSFYEDGKILDVNQSFLKTFGFHKLEITGITTVEAGIMTAEDRARLLEEGNRKGAPRNLPITMRTKYGQQLEGRISSEIITLGSRKCLLSTISQTRLIPLPADPVPSPETEDEG